MCKSVPTFEGEEDEKGKVVFLFRRVANVIEETEMIV
jgi:hypothetical protein